MSELGGSGRIATAQGRLLGLLEDAPREPDFSRGYLDLLSEAGPEPSGVAQRLMHTGVVPRIYERWWRPALFRVAKGPGGPSVAAEQRLARSWLVLSEGDTVLDVACGPGNFTQGLAEAAGHTGLAVGLDGSATMLAQAVSDTWATAATAGAPGGAVYVRADAGELPFRAGGFDAVCCFAALTMFADPMRALDEMTWVLRPGGRIALMASHAWGGPGLAAAQRVPGGLLGMRVFGRDELTGALAERGFTGIRQQVAGLIQFVGGTKAGGTFRRG